MPSYKRNAAAVLAQLVQTEEGKVLTKVACKIQIPARFADVRLAEVGARTYTYGLFPVILLDTGEYSVLNVASIVELNPFRTVKISIDETDYYEFYFEPKQVIINTTDLVKRDTMMYDIMDELIFKGKVPWYVEYEDLGKLFDTALEFGDSRVGDINEVIEFIASMVTRPKKDNTKYLRVSAQSYEDTSLEAITYVPLKSVFYSVNSAVNKLAGSNFNDGVVSALVVPATKVENIESILRA